MKIVGTEREIRWLLETLANGCSGCPYYEDCNRQAKRIAEQGEGMQESCQDYLKKRLELHIRK